MPAADVKHRWLHLTPGRFVIGLLAVEVLLWLSERFQWLRWTMMITVAAVGMAMLLILVWCAVAEIRRPGHCLLLTVLLACGLPAEADDRCEPTCHARGEEAR